MRVYFYIHKKQLRLHTFCSFYCSIGYNYVAESGSILFNCSHINENDQFALFKSTKFPRSVTNFTDIRLIFTGPK